MTTRANAPAITEESIRDFAKLYPNLAEVLNSYFERQRSVQEPEDGFVWIRRAFAFLPSPEHFIHEYLGEWEECASLLESGARSALSQKFGKTLPGKSTRWSTRHNDSFLEVMTELLGYAWLHRHDFGGPKFIEEGFRREPDLAADRAVLECKHIRSSDYERDYYASHQLEARPVSPWAPQLLLAKCQRTLDAALSKFGPYPAPDWSRLLFLDVSVDTMVRIHEHEDPGLLQALAQEIDEYAAERNVGVVVITHHSLRQQVWPV